MCGFLKPLERTLEKMLGSQSVRISCGDLRLEKANFAFTIWRYRKSHMFQEISDIVNLNVAITIFYMKCLPNKYARCLPKFWNCSFLTFVFFYVFAFAVSKSQWESDERCVGCRHLKICRFILTKTERQKDRKRKQIKKKTLCENKEI
jgi:hypothetical protein